jgi:hypothetical protein
VNQSAWAAGNALSVIARGTSISWARKFAVSANSSPALAPRLVVTYTMPEAHERRVPSPQPARPGRGTEGMATRVTRYRRAVVSLNCSRTTSPVMVCGSFSRL